MSQVLTYHCPKVCSKIQILLHTFRHLYKWFQTFNLLIPCTIVGTFIFFSLNFCNYHGCCLILDCSIRNNPYMKIKYCIIGLSALLSCTLLSQFSVYVFLWESMYVGVAVCGRVCINDALHLPSRVPA